MNLLHANCDLLQQGKDLLSRIDQRVFTAVDPASYGSSIGSHLRHVLDHYRSFIGGVSEAFIDYDNRHRDRPEESDLETALQAIDSIWVALDNMSLDLSSAVEVKVRASTEGETVTSMSSFGRELQFLVSHTVHHYALVAIASRMQGVEPGDSFGVAPSTLKFRSTLIK
ncbi:DinB family protein [Pelagicoccus albus]|uniref:DinB-like domain-containing protein n=1 Tax=Pelagicoccus albus TaxID=415222 RepID=A0A7X1B4V9_9BACT|nr:DinB family protein [Pelagicoccus albus]MBC2605701.1 hypothetical protein [Pelagicoccus albus]